MLNKWSLISVSLAAVALCNVVIAAPKPLPQPSLRQGPVRNLPRTHSLMNSMPNMTQIPKSHIVAGLRTDRSGTAFTDSSGKTIARTDRMTGRLVWLDDSPTQSTHAR